MLIYNAEMRNQFKPRLKRKWKPDVVEHHTFNLSLEGEAETADLCDHISVEFHLISSSKYFVAINGQVWYFPVYKCKNEGELGLLITV